MTLTGIIAISGKPGLYKVVAQGKNNVIVESLQDKKRFPAYAKDRISALEDISIFTTGEDKALGEVFQTIFDRENGGKCLSQKEDQKKLHSYFKEILPDFDEDKVYPSDVKKVFAWYNLLLEAGELKPDEKEVKKSAKKAASSEEAETSETKKTSTDKKAPAKKAASTAKKAPVKPSGKTAAKPAAAKKAPAQKSSTSRGK